MTSVRESVRLRRDAELTVGADGAIQLASPLRAVALPLGPALVAAVRALADGSRSDADLTAAAIEAEGASAALKLQFLLRKLDAGGWLEHSISTDTLLATLRPLGHQALHLAAAPPTPQRLSRFAVIRPDGDALLVESPRSTAAVEIIDPAGLPLLGRLARGGDLDDSAVTLALVGLLETAGLLTTADADADPERTDRDLLQWSTTDLMLHATARSGRRADGYGGTYRFTGRFGPLPAVPPERGTERIALPVPDLDAITAADPSLTAVIEQRRSLRAHDDAAPITAAQLGELLYRAMRIRKVESAAGDELVDRPFPAGGALHELEVYPVVTRCDGLAPGVWRYDGAGHAFERIADPSPATAELVAHARAASMLSTDPQVLLVVTARFGRVMWKYESMAYALILKHVGVLYQTLYLVATAMGLAPCAQGGGSADLFADATKIDYYHESSVGEFIVGSRADGAQSMWEAEA